MNTTSGVTLVDSKHPDIGGELLHDERWALALRIASSRQLAKAGQLREMLLYLCQRILTDPNTVIREQEIGCHALGRREDFNPNDDNIVRVQISHLRKKLEEYFSTDGHAETLVLKIPKGSYVPRFAARALVVPEVTAKAEPVVSSPVPAPVSTPARRPLKWFFVAGLVVIIAAIAGFLRIRQKVNAPEDGSLKNDNVVLSTIFTPASRPFIVVADSCLSLLQDALGIDVSLADYISGHFPEDLLQTVKNNELRKTLGLLTSRQYTSLGDVEIASKFMEFGQRLGAAGSIRYARHLNIRDLQSGNTVLIGSRRGNPWAGLFEPQLNFVMMQNPQTHAFYMHNRHPQANELSDYLPVVSNTGAAETYAVIALVPNLSANGYVLMLDGITMESSEAAGELLMRRDFAPVLSKITQTKSAGNVKSLEILIKVRSVGGAASNSSLVAYRLH